MKPAFLISLALLGTLPLVTCGQQDPVPGSTAPVIQQLQAELLASFPAAEAGQGAAADQDHFYAIVNTAIGKYRKTTGEQVLRYSGPRDGLIRHLNSCLIDDSQLLCANSNFPEVPMASSIEIFDADTLSHSGSFSLGVMDEGSLTWFDRLNDGWVAGFAHYSTGGGVPFKDQSYSSVVRFDSSWRRTGGWMIPSTVIARMDPMAASGGALGPDGLLYLTGHDRQEMYVLAAPAMGPKLVHIATVQIPLEGQAFSWDRTTSERVVVGISRPNREVRSFRIPEPQLPEATYPLNDPRVTEVPPALRP
ncbi:MAG: hypothetical protein R3F41_14060 [Gammaproteobacteria bacterium]|nr:hypothetical protein [Pseudomonadales bacterium]MCP5349227.1 hypothetical protein [Pseudomonadales bacterium]